MSEPRIFTKNYVMADDIFVSTHGGTTAYLYDRNSSTQWVTAGANSDATSVDLEISFYENGVAQTRTIDTMFMLNHNLKEWTLYQWNGSSYVSVTSNNADSGANRVQSLSSFSTTKIKLSMLKTQTANQEKAIGELIFGALSLDIGSDMASYDPKWREKSRELVLGDGSIHKVVTRAVSGRNNRYEARVRFQYLTQTQRDNLKSVKETGAPFIWQPESVSLPQEVYYVHWANAWDDKYMASYKGAGYEVTMDVKEV